MKNKKQLLVLTFALLLTTFAVAQMSSPPPAAPAKPFKLPPRQSFTLPNGLVANLVEYGSLPKVQITVAVRAGNLNEKANQVWLAEDFSRKVIEDAPCGTPRLLFCGELALKLGEFVSSDETSIFVVVLEVPKCVPDPDRDHKPNDEYRRLVHWCSRGGRRYASCRFSLLSSYTRVSVAIATVAPDIREELVVGV